MPKQHIYLIPGFFGFVNIGPIVYFSHAKATLLRLLQQRGVDAEIHCVRHSPVASLRQRSHELADEILRSSAKGSESIHLIGHSSGGLDARLLLCENSSWKRSQKEIELRSQVRNCISIATPHQGTPLVSFLSGYLGARFLQALSIATVTLLRTGSIPWKTITRLAGIWVRLRLPSTQLDTLFSELESSLFDHLSPEERDSIRSFFQEVGKDQTLIAQLMPESMELVHHLCQDSPKTNYSCIISRARPPSWEHQFKLHFAPYEQSAYLAYRWLHSCTSKWSNPHLEPLQAHQLKKIVESYPYRIDETDNDGIIPTLSQVHGEIIHAAHADHLDILGHFHSEQHHSGHQAHVDWLPSGSSFSEQDFLSLWNSVAEQIQTGSAI